MSDIPYHGNLAAGFSQHELDRLERDPEREQSIEDERGERELDIERDQLLTLRDKTP